MIEKKKPRGKQTKIDQVITVKKNPETEKKKRKGQKDNTIVQATCEADERTLSFIVGNATNHSKQLSLYDIQLNQLLNELKNIRSCMLQFQEKELCTVMNIEKLQKIIQFHNSTCCSYETESVEVATHEIFLMKKFTSFERIDETIDQTLVTAKLWNISKLQISELDDIWIQKSLSSLSNMELMKDLIIIDEKSFDTASQDDESSSTNCMDKKLFDFNPNLTDDSTSTHCVASITIPFITVTTTTDTISFQPPSLTAAMGQPFELPRELISSRDDLKRVVDHLNTTHSHFLNPDLIRCSQDWFINYQSLLNQSTTSYASSDHPKVRCPSQVPDAFITTTHELHRSIIIQLDTTLLYNTDLASHQQAWHTFIELMALFYRVVGMFQTIIVRPIPASQDPLSNSSSIIDPVPSMSPDKENRPPFCNRRDASSSQEEGSDDCEMLVLEAVSDEELGIMVSKYGLRMESRSRMLSILSAIYKRNVSIRPIHHMS